MTQDEFKKLINSRNKNYLFNTIFWDDRAAYKCISCSDTDINLEAYFEIPKNKWELFQNIKITKDNCYRFENSINKLPGYIQATIAFAMEDLIKLTEYLRQL